MRLEPKPYSDRCMFGTCWMPRAEWAERVLAGDVRRLRASEGVTGHYDGLCVDYGDTLGVDHQGKPRPTRFMWVGEPPRQGMGHGSWYVVQLEERDA